MRKTRFLAAVLALLMVLSIGMTAFADEVKTDKNRYNIVFVTDESGSMEDTDPQKLRYDAIRKFLGYAAETGNCFSNVSYNTDIVAQQDIRPINGIAEKEDFAKEIEVSASTGWTNIGLALKNAVDTLDNNRDESLPSAIILLTDGHTEMKTEELVEESLELKAEAIERARQAGYKIYTICLNTDGSADSSEMKQIAAATGGEFTEIKNPEDLEEVENTYYKIIFGDIGSEDDEKEIGADGVVEKFFNVPNLGVEEINILFEGEFDKCLVTAPDGYVYEGAELNNRSMEGKDFKLVKLLNPQGGKWKAEVYGTPGTKIKFKLLCNSVFNIETSISPEKDYSIGKKVTFTAKIKDEKGVVNDAEKYSKYEGTVHITYNEEEKEYQMNLDGAEFTYEYKIPDKGTYYAYITVEGDGMSADSGKPYELNVDNRTPVAPEETPKAHANRWPFIGGTATLDLKETAKDPDNEKLKFTIESAAFNEDEYKLDGTVLKVDGFSIPKGSFTIRATDPHGAYCTFDVMITSTNIGLLMALTIGIGGLLVLIILGIIIYKKKFIPFMGTITVEKYDDENGGYVQSVSQTPGRGSIRLESFVSGTGLPTGCKFQAGGKDKNVYFTSKKPVYCNISSGPVKKIKIEGSGSDVRISASPEMEKGITVTFKSILYNQFF